MRGGRSAGMVRSSLSEGGRLSGALKAEAEPRAGEEPHGHGHSKCVVGETEEADVLGGEWQLPLEKQWGESQTLGALQDLVQAFS